MPFERRHTPPLFFYLESEMHDSSYAARTSESAENLAAEKLAINRSPPFFNELTLGCSLLI